MCGAELDVLRREGERKIERERERDWVAWQRLNGLVADMQVKEKKGCRLEDAEQVAGVEVEVEVEQEGIEGWCLCCFDFELPQSCYFWSPGLLRTKWYPLGHPGQLTMLPGALY